MGLYLGYQLIEGGHMKKALPVIIIAVIVVIGGIVYAATRNSNSGDNSSMAGMDMSKQTDNSSQTPQATDKVTIQNFSFSPASITVKKGTTVTWTNQDSTAHTITETDGQTGPKSSNLAQGQSYAFTFNSTGTFHYDCSIHPNMTGTVTVTE